MRYTVGHGANPWSGFAARKYAPPRAKRDDSSGSSRFSLVVGMCAAVSGALILDAVARGGEQGNGGTRWLVAVGVLVFVVTAVAVVIVVGALRDENRDSVNEVRRETQEIQQEQIRAEDVREISQQLLSAQQLTVAEQRRIVTRALRRLTVRDRQKLINALLRVATKRQKRLLLGSPTRPSPTRRAAPQPILPPRSIPRSFARPLVTPPSTQLAPVLPPVTQRPQRRPDDDEDENDRENDRERGDGDGDQGDGD